MGKRSSFERVERDFYPTPLEAVHPLLPHLNESSRFIECCAGDGRLVRHLEAAGHSCVSAFDIACINLTSRIILCLHQVCPTASIRIIHKLNVNWRNILKVDFIIKFLGRCKTGRNKQEHQSKPSHRCQHTHVAASGNPIVKTNHERKNNE